MAFLVELTFSERHVPTTSVDGRATGEVARTQIKVSIRLKRARDRNVADVADQASAILAGFVVPDGQQRNPLRRIGGRSRRTVNLLAPWLRFAPLVVARRQLSLAAQSRYAAPQLRPIRTRRAGDALYVVCDSLN